MYSAKDLEGNMPVAQQMTYEQFLSFKDKKSFGSFNTGFTNSNKKPSFFGSNYIGKAKIKLSELSMNSTENNTAKSNARAFEDTAFGKTLGTVNNIVENVTKPKVELGFTDLFKNPIFLLIVAAVVYFLVKK
jgi:hypothetical protein